MERPYFVLARTLLVAASLGAVVLVIDMGSLFASVPSAVHAAAPYATAALLLLASGWLIRVDPPRSRLLAIGGAILLGSWVAAVGYGPRELASSVAVVVATIAALCTLVGMSARWLVVTLVFLGLVAAALTYLHLEHPPLGLIAIYGVAGAGLSAAVLSFLPQRARRWPLAARAVFAVTGWLAGALLFVVAYGLPLGNS